jgi:hypothetical protein
VHFTELARIIHADREREIREHLRVRSLINRALEDAEDRSTEPDRRPRLIGRRTTAPGGAAR